MKCGLAGGRLYNYKKGEVTFYVLIQKDLQDILTNKRDITNTLDKRGGK